MMGTIEDNITVVMGPERDNSLLARYVSQDEGVPTVGMFVDVQSGRIVGYASPLSQWTIPDRYTLVTCVLAKDGMISEVQSVSSLQQQAQRTLYNSLNCVNELLNRLRMPLVYPLNGFQAMGGHG